MVDTKGSSSADADASHKQWDEISCPICMDHPHNAVLLLCTSHDKGCRCYICDTSYRHSNCLDRFKKLRGNAENGQTDNSGRSDATFEGQGMSRNQIENHGADNLEDNISENVMVLPELLRENHSQEVQETINSEEPVRCDIHEQKGVLKCPLCRGDVLGWKIVKDVRQYLDQKPRSCSRESCSFSGNYGELRRHARRVHPTSRPADVDPSRRRAWHRMEHQREYGDILSAIRSAMPGAVVLGDYVIDNGNDPYDREIAGVGDNSGPWWTTLFLFHMFSSPLGSLRDPRSSRVWRRHRRTSRHRNLWGESLTGSQGVEYSNEHADIDAPFPRRRRRFSRSMSDEERS